MPYLMLFVGFFLLTISILVLLTPSFSQVDLMIVEGLAQHRTEY